MDKLLKPMLFLGSGISLPTGLPDLSEITAQLFQKEWHKHSDQTFYPGPSPNPHDQGDEYVFVVKSFLKLLNEFSAPYLLDRRSAKTNYEDIYYLCRQIVDNERLEIDNPAIEPFVRIIRRKSKCLISQLSDSYHSVDLAELASNAMVYINCVIYYALYTNKMPIGLGLICELAKVCKALDIVSLNHDLLIENELNTNKIEFVDGFGKPNSDVRLFDSRLFDKRTPSIKLYKLHGSINWHRFQDEVSQGGHKKYVDRYCASLNRDFQHSKSGRRRLLFLNYTPIFLTGTYNKLSDYNFGIIRHIQTKFEKAITQHNIIIMSGYGWNDRGINGQLFDWLFSSSHKRIILLHKDPEKKIKEESRSGMWHRYDKLVSEGRLIPIKKWLSEISLDEILPIITD